MFYLPINQISSDQFVTQNLRGDSIDTWHYWNIIDKEDIFHIHLNNEAKISEEQMEIIYKSILSTESIQIDNSLLGKEPAEGFSNFYLGWAGVMNTASKIETKYVLPTNFHVHENSSKDGDIVITLTNLKSTEGYNGYTRSLVNDNQIFKSYITIYDIDSLSLERFKAILRHELGHAFGLIHSSDSNDLMHPTITTPYPYISECSIEALRELYNGNTDDAHICTK